MAGAVAAMRWAHPRRTATWVGRSTRKPGDRSRRFEEPTRERARALLARVFDDLATSSQIHADEFELVQVADDRFIVVLPGVIDLSHLDPLLSDRHRSVRDLDQYAIRSSRSTSVDENRYAAMVWQALEAVDVPRGAELMIVGHSFGADTALDLASDHRFNGDRFRVTHVVAAGYHSQPQLEHVTNGTKVLVVQNRHDLVVTAERVGTSSVADSVVDRVRQLGDVLQLDPVAAAGRAREILGDDLDALAELRKFAVTHADDIGGVIGAVAIGATTGNWDADERRRQRARRARSARSSVVGDDIVVDVFDGGTDGVRPRPVELHRPPRRRLRRRRHLARSNDLDPAVVDFLTSVGEAGYAGPGSAVAVDVSGPVSVHRSLHLCGTSVRKPESCMCQACVTRW